MGKTELLIVSQAPDGTLSVSGDNSMQQNTLEEVAAAVLKSLLNRGADLLRVMYKLRTAEVVQSGPTTPPIVIT